MIKIFTRTSAALIFFVVFTSSGQEDEMDLLVNDFLKIASDFATPAAEGAAYQSSGGWFSSASNLDLWQVDLSVHANVLLVPHSKRTTSIASADYATFDIQGAETAEIPTAFGTVGDVVFEGEIYGQPFQFQALQGIDKKIIPHPFVQATVGVPFGTDVSLRFLPEVTVDDVRFSTYGIGLKHNFNQYFFHSRPTDFQFAALVAYSKFKVDYEFIPVVIDLVAELNEVKVDADLWLLQFISSKSFRDSNWEVFAAVGATNSSFGYSLGGGGPALGQINAALTSLNKNEVEIKGDLGFNYKINNFMLSTMFSMGKFYNLNFGFHYKL